MTCMSTWGSGLTLTAQPPKKEERGSWGKWQPRKRIVYARHECSARNTFFEVETTRTGAARAGRVRPKRRNSTNPCRLRNQARCECRKSCAQENAVQGCVRTISLMVMIRGPDSREFRVNQLLRLP